MSHSDMIRACLIRLHSRSTLVPLTLFYFSEEMRSHGRKHFIMCHNWGADCVLGTGTMETPFILNELSPTYPVDIYEAFHMRECLMLLAPHGQHPIILQSDGACWEQNASMHIFMYKLLQNGSVQAMHQGAPIPSSAVDKHATQATAHSVEACTRGEASVWLDSDGPIALVRIQSSQ